MANYLYTKAKLNTTFENIKTLQSLYDLTAVTPITLRIDKENAWKQGTTRILNGDLYIFFKDHNNKFSSCEVKPMFEKKWYQIKQM